ncbi:MAG: hypothetical protein AB9836_03525 [Aminipila sp.]
MIFIAGVFYFNEKIKREMILTVVSSFMAIEIIKGRKIIMTEEKNTEFVLTEEIINECLQFM